MGEEAYVPGPEEDYNPGADKILVDKANNTITFVYDETDAELMKQYNALPTFADVPADAWYQLYVSHLSQLGIVSGRTESSFMPQEAVTRNDASQSIFRIQPGGGYFAYLGSTTISHTRDCLTRNERGVAGLA